MKTEDPQNGKERSKKGRHKTKQNIIKKKVENGETS